MFPLYQKMNKRVSNVQYIVDLARDTILNGGYKLFKSQEIFQQYIDKINQDEENLYQLYKQGLPGSFGDFNDFFYNSSFLDMC